MTDSVWALDLVEDIEAPGWLFIPGDLGDQQRREWISAVLPELVGKEGWNGDPIEADDALDVLTSALAERDQSDSIAMFQVWPPLGGDTATCHIGVFPTAEMPDWLDSDAVVHRFDAPHIGPGIQCSTKRVVSIEDGPDIDLSGVHFIFKSEEVTLVVGLDHTHELLTVNAIRGTLALLGQLRLIRSSDGQKFQSVAFEGVLEESPWRFEVSA